MIFRSRAPKEIFCEACFVDYQSAVIGILRNKASSENRFRREGINFSGIVNSVNVSFRFVSFRFVSLRFVSFRFAEYRKPERSLTLINQKASLVIGNPGSLGAPGDEYNKSPCREGTSRLFKDITSRPTIPSGIHSSPRANHACASRWVKGGKIFPRVKSDGEFCL